MDRLDDAIGLLGEAIEDARKRGALPGVALASAFRSHAALRRGNVLDAEADARSALELVEPGVLGHNLPFPLAFLLDALIERGEYAEADNVLEQARLPVSWPNVWQFNVLLGSRGRLRIEQGRIEEGVADVVLHGERLSHWGLPNPTSVPWRSTTALALLAADRTDEASALAEDELERARTYGIARALGVALRAAGLVDLAQGGGHERLIEAVSVLEQSPAMLEHARALVDLGAARRGAGDRDEARDTLRGGMELAQRCGAGALVKRAHEELLATGARPRRLMVTGVDSLTTSERRVASWRRAARPTARWPRPCS